MRKEKKMLRQPKKLLLTLLCVLQGCGQMNSASSSGVHAFSHQTETKMFQYFFAKDDLSTPLEENLDRGWLTLVRCDGSENAATLAKLDLLSDFESTGQCSKLALPTFDAITPTRLIPGEKAPVRFIMGGGGAARKQSLIAAFSRSFQQILMPVQAASSLLWAVYIFQMVKSDSGASLKSLTKFGKTYLVTPVVSSFKLLSNAISGNPLTLEKFFLSAKQMTEAEHLASFLEFLSHPKQQAFYADDMAREFTAFLKVNKNTGFVPAFLKDLSVQQLRTALLDPVQNQKITRLIVQAKNSKLGFDLSWFKTKNEWLVGNNFLPKLIKAKDLDHLDELLVALKQPGSKINRDAALKKARKIYRQLRPGSNKLANKLVAVGVWLVVAKIGWDMLTSTLEADGKTIVADLLANQFAQATLMAHQNIKASSECTNELKRALEVFDRRSILETTIASECGNLVKELNSTVVTALNSNHFLKEQDLMKAFTGVSLIVKTIPDLIEVSFEPVVLP